MKRKHFLTIVLFMMALCLSFHAVSAENNTPDDTTAPAAAKKTVVITYDPADKKITETIPFETLDYSTVKEHCEKMLSPDGYILTLPERNSIIVHDTKKNIEKIKELIKAVDRPAVNIRIDFGSTNVGNAPNDRLSADIEYAPPHKDQGKIIIEDGKIVKPKSITVHTVKGTQSTTRNNSSFLVTQSGKAASLFVGSEIIDPSWLAQYKLVPTVIVIGGGSVVTVPGSFPDFKWRNVGTSLKILPTLKDNGLIDVEIYPEVSYVDGKGKHQAVKVESVTTRLTVQEEQTIPLGGIVDTHREFYSDFFGPDFRRTGGGGILDMTLKATIQKHPSRIFDAPRTTDPSPSPENNTGTKTKDGLYHWQRGENPHQWR